MDHDLIELAGGEEQSDPQREECLAELGRVIDRLHGRGMSVATHTSPRSPYPLSAFSTASVHEGTALHRQPPTFSRFPFMDNLRPHFRNGRHPGKLGHDIRRPEVVVL